MRGTNDYIIDISSSGITGTGGIFGTTNPGMEGLLTSFNSGLTGLRLHVRNAVISTPVSSTGNNKFLSPVTFGEDKVIITVDGITYNPTKDYSIKGNEVTWKNPDVTLSSANEVVLFGPANEYTAKAFTIESFNLGNAAIYNSGAIQLGGANEGVDSYPYSENSVYLFIKGLSYTPGTNFSYNSITQKLHIDAAIETISPTDDAFAFYYNLYPTQPFRLGEALIREQRTNGTDLTSLVSGLDKTLRNATNVYLNAKRAMDKKNYSITNNIFGWKASGGEEFDNGDLLDISYFKDISYSIEFFTEMLAGTDFPNAPVNNLPVTNTKGLLFMRGLLSIAPEYDNISNPAAKDYTVTGNLINWIGTPAITNNDTLVWRGLTDAQSDFFVKILYFTDSTTAKALPNIANNQKLIYFLNGQARFLQDAGCTLSSDSVSLANLSTSASDKIVVLYFTQAGYADLWKFVKLNLTSNWIEGGSRVLPFPVRNAKSLMLFNQGVCQEPGVDYDVDSSGTIITNINMGLIPLTNSVMLVYL